MYIYIYIERERERIIYVYPPRRLLEHRHLAQEATTRPRLSRRRPSKEAGSAPPICLTASIFMSCSVPSTTQNTANHPRDGARDCTAKA